MKSTCSRAGFCDFTSNSLLPQYQEIMSSTHTNPEIADYKLQTDFHNDHVIHSTYIANAPTRPPVQTKWTDQRILGSGGYGVVSLQTDEAGTLRAVKRLPIGLRSMDYSRELKALAKVSDVCITMLLKLVMS